jgi:hypothetical protein
MPKVRDLMAALEASLGIPCPCTHSWDEHDGMGDCHHPDKRTVTGYCRRYPHEGRDE